jgi:hypothetical protein
MPTSIPVKPEAVHWQRVNALFHAVHDLPPEAQAAWLQGGDGDGRRGVAGVRSAWQ